MAINTSKIAEDRFWRKWRKSGAVSPLFTFPPRRKMIPIIRRSLERLGILTPQEIETVVRARFIRKPWILQDQLEYLYLELKIQEKQHYKVDAELFKKKVDEVLSEKLTEKAVRSLCLIVSEYFQGYKLLFNGKKWAGSRPIRPEKDYCAMFEMWTPEGDIIYEHRNEKDEWVFQRIENKTTGKFRVERRNEKGEQIFLNEDEKVIVDLRTAEAL
jgi:hypothetical protein